MANSFYESSMGWAREGEMGITPIRTAQVDNESRKILKDLEESISDQFDVFKTSIMSQIRLIETAAYFNGRKDERAEWERGQNEGS